MKDVWKVTVWGVRGSFPIASADYLKYGGNTSCISAEWGDTIIIFDAGTGLMKLGDSLSRRGIRQVNILISHLHMDHCMGLFNFRLFHDPHAEIHLYGSSHGGIGLEQGLKALIGPPYWPLRLTDFPAHVEIHELTPGQLFRPAGAAGSSPEVTVRTLAGNHPNESLYFRLESGGRSVVYALDCEMNRDMEQSLAEFAGNSSLLIWDANFTEEALAQYKGWGHSAWNQGIALRRKAGAEAVLMTHFSSSYNDIFLQEQERLCSLADPASRFAKEGMAITIPQLPYKDLSACKVSGPPGPEGQSAVQAEKCPETT